MSSFPTRFLLSRTSVRHQCGKWYVGLFSQVFTIMTASPSQHLKYKYRMGGTPITIDEHLKNTPDHSSSTISVYCGQWLRMTFDERDDGCIRQAPQVSAEWASKRSETLFVQVIMHPKRIQRTANASSCHCAHKCCRPPWPEATLSALERRFYWDNVDAYIRLFISCYVQFRSSRGDVRLPRPFGTVVFCTVLNDLLQFNNFDLSK